MGLIQDRLGYLLRENSAEDIAQITGISLASISPAIDQGFTVDPNVRRNVYNFYFRQSYADLRAVGASSVESRRYRGKNISLVEARIGQRSELINDLVNGRFDQYKAYLTKQGRFVSDADTLATLRESIVLNMGKSKLPPSDYDYDSYPTLDYGVLDDDF